MARKMCDVCGVRPATTQIRRVIPGGGQRVEHLCDVHAAQARGRRSSLGGGSPFDDFFTQFFETPGRPHRIPIGQEATGRRAEQVDVTTFFSESTSELLRRAAQRAMEWGSADLTTEHLLYAALEDGMARHVIEWVDSDPDAISAQLEEEADKGGHTNLSSSLAPDAKRALLAAYEETQAWVPRASVPSTSCSRWPKMRSPRPDACSRASGSRIPSYAERSCAV